MEIEEFSKDDLVAADEPLAYSIFLPETVVKKGRMIDLILNPELQEHVDERKNALLGKPEIVRQKHNGVVAIVCSMLAEKPNVKGFPDDDRTLYERAYEFFTADNPKHLQRAFDKGFEKILLEYWEVTDPEVFFRGFASDYKASNLPEPGDQPNSKS